MVEEKQSAKEDFASLNGMSITAAKVATEQQR